MKNSKIYELLFPVGYIPGSHLRSPIAAQTFEYYVFFEEIL